MDQNVLFFLPVRKAKERLEVYIVVSFGLGYRVRSPRIDAAVEPYPGRFTHGKDFFFVSMKEEAVQRLTGTQ